MYSLHQTVNLMLIFTDMPSSCSLAVSYSDVTAYVKPGTCTKFAKCAFCSLFFFVCSSSAVNIQYNIGSVDWQVGADSAVLPTPISLHS